MSCCSCNLTPCCCPEIPVGTTTTTTTTLCPGGEPCAEAYASDCVIYHGPGIPCYDILPGMSVTEILEIIMSQLNCTTTTTTQAPTTRTATIPSADNDVTIAYVDEFGDLQSQVIPANGIVDTELCVSCLYDILIISGTLPSPIIYSGCIGCGIPS